MQFVFVYQREPHARQMAFEQIAQPEHIGERCELARKTCEELQLPADRVWIDGMDDQSRALFGDLPSPAIVIDACGIVRHKLPWCEPEALQPVLEAAVSRDRRGAAARLQLDPRAEPADEPEAAWLGAALGAVHRGAALPQERARRPAVLWAAAVGAVPEGELPDSWLGLVACATLAERLPDHAACSVWLDRLIASNSVPARHWALVQRVAGLRELGEPGAAAQAAAERELAALRREHAWLAADAR